MTQVAHGELDGRRAVVTGGASGIGEALARGYAFKVSGQRPGIGVTFGGVARAQH